MRDTRFFVSPNMNTKDDNMQWGLSESLPIYGNSQVALFAVPVWYATEFLVGVLLWRFPALPLVVHCAPLGWVVVKELNLSYYHWGIILIAIYTHYGNPEL